MESSQTSASFFGPLLVVVGLGPPMLLDAFVKMTGYARRSALRLLNHPPERTGPIWRPRLPVYGSEVQQA